MFGGGQTHDCLKVCHKHLAGGVVTNSGGESAPSVTPHMADLQNWKHLVTHFLERGASSKDCFNLLCEEH